MRKGKGTTQNATKRVQVKIGICKRMAKEVDFYKKESKMNEEKLNKMRADNKDEYGK